MHAHRAHPTAAPAPRTGPHGRAPPAPGGARAARCTSAARTGAPTRRAASASSSAGASAGVTCSRSVGHAGVLQAHGELGGARAGAGDPADSAGEHLEVGVPHPGDVAPVGRAVVEDRQQVELLVLEHERAQDLVRAGRVLDQQHLELDVADRDPLGPAERGLDVAQAGRPRLRAGRRARGTARRRRARCRRCRAPEAAARPSALPTGVASSNLDRRVPSSSIRSAATAGAGRSCAARRAAVATEMAEVDRVVDVRGAAAAAMLGVGRVLHLGDRHRRVLDAEVRHVPARRVRGRRSAGRRR